MYSSLVDVRNALTSGGLATDSTTAASLPDEQINDAIAEADALIDSYLTIRYLIPQDPSDDSVAVVPVRFWSRDIAAYLATLTFKRSKDVPQDEPIRLRFNIVMAQLTAIRDGKATVDLPSSAGDDDVVVVNLYNGTLFGPADFLLTPADAVWTGPGRWPGGL